MAPPVHRLGAFVSSAGGCQQPILLVPTNETPWFKTAIIYELHVRSFCDSNADGIGDFTGLISKLDYLQDLGVTALWLLPFYPSPLLDDGYDISDYHSVNPSYGTLDDFRDFLSQAHDRGLKVITELVINHTSDQHPWFQRARLSSRGSPERDFYVWSDTPEAFEEARIIFKDFESSNWAWDAVASAYYWHRFYSHQPDLNFDNPEVQKAVFETLDFWLSMGVDGLRLDAVPYLFEREGTSCENLPETHEFLRKLRGHVDGKFPDRMLLAEANQWPEDAAAYFGQGDECHMEFHFPLMPRLFMSLQMEDRFPLVDILEQTPPIPDGCQWAIFLRNHDELTLEMVTDEERDYMVRIYAGDARARINLGIRRRLAPLLGNDRRKMELINSLLLSLPGTPILYYGDEIGMGDNFYLGDRNGVRTPMQWNADRNAGFSRANPQQLFLPVIIDPEFHYETVNTEMQRQNLSSLFWWMRRTLGVRKSHPAFSAGELKFLPCGNPKVVAFLRCHEEEVLLVVANLSRFSQSVGIPLAGYEGWIPRELFGGSHFPAICKEPFLFTLGPHGFFWLALQRPDPREAAPESGLPILQSEAEWTPGLLRALEQNVLPHALRQYRWFGAKQNEIREIRIAECFAASADDPTRVLLVDVAFYDRASATYVLPLTIGPADLGDPGAAPLAGFPNGKVIWDSLAVGGVRERILRIVEQGEVWRAGSSKLEGYGSADATGEMPSRKLGGEQSNSSIVFGEKLTLKLFRQFEAGPHPDAGILQALARASFPHVPSYFGEIRCSRNGLEGVVGLLTSYVSNQGDGWLFIQDALQRFWERILAAQPEASMETLFPEVVGANVPERIRQLGQRTGELHRCLQSMTSPAFAPEAFTGYYQRSLYQSLRNMVRRTELELRQSLERLPGTVRPDAERWLESVPQLLGFYSRLMHQRLDAKKIRIHGDYHLGQVLNTGKDFVILDFEGEPRRSLGERLLKRSAMVDVAGMIRSFDYAVQIALRKARPEDQPRLQAWGRKYLDHISTLFLSGYSEATRDCDDLLPSAPEDFQFLLRACLLDKTVYEIGYELGYRLDFLEIPLRSSIDLLGTTIP